MLELDAVVVLLRRSVDVPVEILTATEEALAAGVDSVRSLHEVLLECGERVSLVWL